MLQFDEYKVKLNNLRPQLDELEKALNLDSTAQEVDFLEAESASDGFLGQPGKVSAGAAKAQAAQSKLESQAKRRSSWEDMMVPVRNGQRGGGRVPPARIGRGVQRAGSEHGIRPTADAADRGIRCLNAILAFHAGAGGTEAQDWAQMLYTHVYPVGRAPRVHLQSHGLSRGTRPASSPPPS